MATEEELNNQKDLNDELLKSAEAYSKLKESQQDILFFSRDYADEAKRAAKEVLGSTIAASSTAKAFKDVAAAAKKITDNYSGVLTGQKQFVDLQKESAALEASKASLATEYAQALVKIGFNQAEINSVINEGVEASSIFDAQGKDMTTNQMVLLELFEEQNQQLEDEAANMSDIAKRAGVIDEAMRPLGKSALSLQDMGEGLTKGLSSAGLGNLSGKLGMEEAITGARETAAGLTEGGTKALGMSGKLKVAGNMATTMGKNLMKSLGPATLLAMAIEEIVNAFKLIDGKSGEVAKSMGVSAAEGRKLLASSADTAAMSGDLLTSTGDIVNAQMKLNAVMGTSVSFPKEMALDFAQISERTGLSAEAMQHFAKFAIQGKGGIKEQLQDISDTTTELNSQFGVSLNMKDIQEGIGKLSASQRLSARGNTDELTKQVFLSKMLGLSASQLEGVQGSLLDFESSIGAEMEAELLTGKQLNLEGARAAALAGDQAALAAELAKEVGTEAEFMKMNVIQREAMAKAFGLNVDQMAEMLASQEAMDAMVEATGGKYKTQSEAQAAFNKLIEGGASAEAAAAEMRKQGIDDALASQMKSATNQDKMNAAMEKFSDLFVQLIDPLMPLVDALMAILDPVFAILSPILKLIGDLVGLIMDFLNPSLESIIKMFEGISEVFTSLFNADLGGIVSGFKTIGDSIISYLLSPINGAIRLMNNIPGIDIGEIPVANSSSNSLAEVPKFAEGGIVTSPTMGMIGEGGESEAIIPLSKLADVLPNAMGGGNKDADSEQLKSLNAKMSQLITLIERGGDVYIDGAKAGKSMVMATSNLG